jgi:hypothetical protein
MLKAGRRRDAQQTRQRIRIRNHSALRMLACVREIASKPATGAKPALKEKMQSNLPRLSEHRAD